MLVNCQTPTLFPAYDLKERELRNVSMLFRVLELVPTLAGDLFGEIGVYVGNGPRPDILPKSHLKISRTNARTVSLKSKTGAHSLKPNVTATHWMRIRSGVISKSLSIMV